MRRNAGSASWMRAQPNLTPYLRKIHPSSYPNYAIADASAAIKIVHADMRVVSIGVGTYPEPKPSFWAGLIKKNLVSVQLLQKTLEINTQSMDQLRKLLFANVPTVRISDTFERPEMATDLLEHNLEKLNILHQRGRDSFAAHEAQLKAFLL